jgi:hypothetical protein
MPIPAGLRCPWTARGYEVLTAEVKSRVVETWLKLHGMEEEREER